MGVTGAAAALACIRFAPEIQFAAGVLIGIEPGIGVFTVVNARGCGLDFPHQSGELIQYTGAGFASLQLNAVRPQANIFTVVNVRAGARRATCCQQHQAGHSQRYRQL